MKKRTVYIMTENEYKKLDKRIAKMTGYNLFIRGMKSKLAELKVEIRIMKNEIKAINMRLQRLNKRRKKR